MNKLLIVAGFSCFLTACGGGSDSDTTPPPDVVTPPTISSTLGQVELGPVKNATISIQDLEGNTLVVSTTNDQGEFKIDIEELKKAVSSSTNTIEIVKIVSVGGIDTDPDDDGLFVINEEKSVQGTVSGFVPLKTIYEKNGYKINLISTFISDLLKNSESVTLDQILYIANTIGVQDIDNDGQITIEDIIFYDMSQNETLIESELREQYLNYIHSGNDSEKQAYLVDKEFTDSLTKLEVTENSSDYKVKFSKINSNSVIKYAVVSNPDVVNYSENHGEDITVNYNNILLFQECIEEYCNKLQHAYFLKGEYAQGYIPSKKTTQHLADILAAITVITERIKQLDGTIAENNDKINEIEQQEDELDVLLNQI
jgi:hypothetical protein